MPVAYIENPFSTLPEGNPQVEHADVCIVVDRAKIMHAPNPEWELYAGLTGRVRKAFGSHLVGIILDFASTDELFRRRSEHPAYKDTEITREADLCLASKFLSKLDPMLDRQILQEVRVAMADLRREGLPITTKDVRDRASLHYTIPFVRLYMQGLEPSLEFGDWYPLNEEEEVS